MGETLRGQDVTYQFGGKGGNQAIATTRAVKVSFAGASGMTLPDSSAQAIAGGRGGNQPTATRRWRIRHERRDCDGEWGLRRGDCIGRKPRF